MSNIPADRKYAVTHEWAQADASGIVTVGISDHAQIALGDVVFVELPEVGAHIDAGDEAGVVESVKAASDIYAPVSGEVIEVNEALESSPERPAYRRQLELGRKAELCLGAEISAERGGAPVLTVGVATP